MVEGCLTALVTPFKDGGLSPDIDWTGLDKLIEEQNKAGISGIVPCGTTGESPTLTRAEKNRIFEVCVSTATCEVYAGTGTNSTATSIELTKHAERCGADGVMLVCPYYNKPSQEGLYRHYSAVASSTSLPIIVYNVPSRSSREIAATTLARLAREHSNIVAVKEASGSPDVWRQVRDECGDKFTILSGNDSDTLALMRDHGAKGLVSVASNVIPKRMVEFVALGSKGDFAAMLAENEALEEFFKDLFIDTNPVMVKEALMLLNKPSGGLRLPMCETTPEKREKMRDSLKKIGVL